MILVSAVVLVNTDMAEREKVLRSIKQVNGVEEAHVLWGVYDLLVRVKANSIDKLREIIRYSLRELAGVSSILTLLILE